MEVSKPCIYEVFEQTRRYEIPLFQRPYVWSEEEWLHLWQDISSCAEFMLGKNEILNHVRFLGAVVIQVRKIWGSQIKSHDVIDGQQRLTTFQVFLSALRDIAILKKESDIYDDLKKLTINTGRLADPSKEKYKIWPIERDRKIFCDIMMCGSIVEVEKIYPPIYKRKKLQPRHKLVESYVYFYKSINQWIDEGDEGDCIDKINSLITVIKDHLQIVVIELGDQEDPQTIFETLNARGVPLLASDLIKNYIFQRIDHEKALKVYQEHWSYFDLKINDEERVNFWETQITQGRLSRARIDLFLQYYLSMNMWKDLGSTSLYAEYKNWIEKENPFQSNPEKELINLILLAKKFYCIINPVSEDRLSLFSKRVKVIEASPVYPLILSIFSDENINEAEKEKITEYLESFLVRRMICSKTSKNYNKLFLSIGQNFNRISNRNAEDFKKLLLSGTGDTNEWPSDEQFKQGWMTIDAYKNLKPAKVEMIFQAIELYMHTSKNENILINQKLTIEHIMPQSWREYWPLPEGDEDEKIQDRNELIHDFGNLTLLTQPLNSAVSNGPAKDKLIEISKQSSLLINNYFQNKYSWSEDDVLSRSELLFEVVVKIWQKP